MSGEDFRQALGYVQGSLDGLRQSVEKIAEAMTRRLDDHEVRIQAVERRQEQWTGAIRAARAGWLFVGGVIGAVVKHLLGS